MERVYHFNKAGAPPWWIYSRILGVRAHQQAGVEDVRQDGVDLSRLDPLMPWPGLSLIVVARKTGGGAAGLSTANQEDIAQYQG